jgi:hypothetical protein
MRKVVAYALLSLDGVAEHPDALTRVARNEVETRGMPAPGLPSTRPAESTA